MWQNYPPELAAFLTSLLSQAISDFFGSCFWSTGQVCAFANSTEYFWYTSVSAALMGTSFSCEVKLGKEVNCKKSGDYNDNYGWLMTSRMDNDLYNVIYRWW